MASHPPIPPNPPNPQTRLTINQRLVARFTFRESLRPDARATLDRLATAGLVERRTLNGDRRTHAIHLTPEGLRLAQLGLATQRAFLADTLGSLSQEQLAQMDALFVQTSEILRKSEAAATGDR